MHGTPMSVPRKIALFGGTFDPVHLGHVYLADLARKALALDEVRFLPCRVSPHKTGKVTTPAAVRLEMLWLATEGLAWAVVDDCEVRRDGPSFSYLTAEAMSVLFPDARLFWIMGMDQWEALPDWAEPQRLAEIVEFIVFARGHIPAPRDGYRLHFVEGEHPASSSAIRHAIASGESEHPWLAPNVARWIREHRVYEKLA